MIISDKNNSAIRLILPEDSPISELSAISGISIAKSSINQSIIFGRKQNICSGIFSFTGNSWFKIISNYDEIQKIIYHGFANGKLISE